MTQRFWHGSKELVFHLDPRQTLDGGLHLGTRAQAAMRNSKVLYEIEVDISCLNIRRCRDEGGNWSKRIRDARSKGFDAIVYLNRYEGMSIERIEALAASGDLPRLDDASDAKFRNMVPEAEDSLILLPGTSYKIISRQLRKA